jgi:hypothetical protein
LNFFQFDFSRLAWFVRRGVDLASTLLSRA